MNSNFLSSTGSFLKRQMHALRKARKGNIAMIFALSAVPLLVAGGSGIDLARSMAVRGKLYSAVDAAALAVAAKQGITQSQAQVLAQQFFDANYKLDNSFGTPNPVNVVIDGQKVTVSSNMAMPTTLMKLGGIQNVNLSASSDVVWGQTKIWVGLALDNTGSMCEPSSSPCPSPGTNTKIYALKDATKSLLTMFQGASATAGDVQVSLVPFSRDVNIGATYAASSWIDWSEWDEDHGTCSISGYNAKSACEAASVGTCSIGGTMSASSCATQGTCSVGAFTTQSTCTNSSTGGTCSLTAYTNKSNCQSAAACSVGSFASSSTCTNASTGGVCSIAAYTTKSTCQAAIGSCSNPVQTTATNCTTVKACSLSAYTTKNPCQNNGGTWGYGAWTAGVGVWTAGVWAVGAWTPSVWTAATFTSIPGVWTPIHTAWNGCITDRGRWESVGPGTPAYDTLNTAPNTANESKFPASDHGACPPATLMGLSYNWTTLNAKVDTMVANGNTNQTIGLAWAWHSLSQGIPLTPPALPAATTRHIIILSDGENTQNRWSNDRSTIDGRMNTLCTNAKSDGVIIWSVFVNIAGTAGNAQSMKDCASGGATGGHYIEVTSASGIGTAFDVIGQQITNLRVAH